MFLSVSTIIFLIDNSFYVTRRGLYTYIFAREPYFHIQLYRQQKLLDREEISLYQKLVYKVSILTIHAFKNETHFLNLKWVSG